MASVEGPERLILKVLTGVQIGAEVALAPGEYLLGSGADDDVQFIDVSVKPGHARLRIDPRAISVRAEADAISLNDGSQLAAKGDWREIQPLDIVRIGAVTFAVGLPNAQWSTVTEEIAPRVAAPEAAAPQTPDKVRRALASRLPEQVRAMVIPITTAVGLIVFAIWLAVGANRGAPNRSEDAKKDFETVREALGKLPFARQIEARQDVDGQIYVAGYVNSAVERRAAAGAIDKTGVPAHMRIEVLAFLRSEIDNLISEEKVKVSYSLSPTGELTLNGVILSEADANKFVSRVQDGVIGLKKIDSKIRTGKALLVEIERLARVSQIDQKIILRLEQNVVEANGVIGADKIDAWVGFLQAYSKHFSADIGLRSYVQLQYDPSVAGMQLPPGGLSQPISIGAEARANLDLDRLRDGSFKLSDIFAGTVGGGPAADAAGAAAATGAARAASSSAASPGSASPRAAPGSSSPASGARLAGGQSASELQSGAGAASAPGASARNAGAAASAAIAGANDPAAAGQAASADALLFADKGGVAQTPSACRRGSRLTPGNIAVALDMLDRMSVSNTESARALDPAKARILLEVALDPSFAARCLLRANEHSSVVENSTYLAEVARNSGFAEVVTREFPAYDLPVSGVSLAGRRFVQTKTGVKLYEGAAPDGASRLDAIGELGAVVRTPTGLARALYARDANWILRTPLRAAESAQ